MLYKSFEEGDITTTPFKVYKQFQFTNADSGSGVFCLEGTSGSFHNFNTGSAASKSFGTINELSQSLGRPKDEWYSVGTFYNLTVWNSVNHLYYKYSQENTPRGGIQPQYTFVQNPYPHTFVSASVVKELYPKLHNTVNVINVPRKFYGEEIKPNSVKLVDNSLSYQTLYLNDDGRGNLYDTEYSQSFSYGSSSYSGSQEVGGIVGNVFYDQGIITVTDTGSRYTNVGLLSGSDGWDLEFQGTKTRREYEFLCNVQEYEYNGTDNISATVGYSGSQLIGSDLTMFYNPSVINPITGSAYNQILRSEEYDTSSVYRPAGKYQNFVTHSDFNPYISSVGLYNAQNELLAVAKLSRPIKKPKEYDISFTIRFDN